MGRQKKRPPSHSSRNVSKYKAQALLRAEGDEGRAQAVEAAQRGAHGAVRSVQPLRVPKERVGDPSRYVGIATPSRVTWVQGLSD